MESLIRNTKQIKQAIDFTKVQNGKIHPTDIDAVLEFDNEALILIEVKSYKKCLLPKGQRLVLERIVDSWHTQKAIVLLVEHYFENEDENIPLHLCKIKSFYHDKTWREDENKTSLIKCLNGLGKNWKIKKLRFEE